MLPSSSRTHAAPEQKAPCPPPPPAQKQPHLNIFDLEQRQITDGSDTSLLAQARRNTAQPNLPQNLLQAAVLASHVTTTAIRRQPLATTGAAAISAGCSTAAVGTPASRTQRRARLPLPVLAFPCGAAGASSGGGGGAAAAAAACGGCACRQRF